MLLMNTAIDAFLAISWPLFVTGTWSKKEPTKGSATDTSLAVMPKSTAIWLKVDEVEYSAVQLKVTLDENSTELITVGWSSGYITTLNSRAPARDDALTEVTMVVAVVPSVTNWVSYTLQVLVTESYRPTAHQRESVYEIKMWILMSTSTSKSGVRNTVKVFEMLVTNLITPAANTEEECSTRSKAGVKNGNL